ncbi:hypothetical protein Lal_00018850 [Lupinus albus]|uniref:Putative transcription factor C2H2 family n=1 Tax=Lupinus albus TaxID=3870 RepID=A0A6A4P1K1_LUPAL|nr:putative transcription factor C2H2 family [Lupinus albus]KAF1863006.1 hypothetical protein Lal_00018850 [Lupinus albus]
MSYTTFSDLHQTQTQTHTPISDYTLSIPSYPHYVSYPQNPNPSSYEPSLETHVVEPGLNPPGVDSYTPLTATNSITHLGHEAIPNYCYGHGHVVDSSSLEGSSVYYLNPNSQNWAASDSVVTTTPLNVSEQLAAAYPNPAWWINTATQPRGNETWKKYPKKVKTNIVKPAYCEVCKIECTSVEVLHQHKLGKKHKKNLEALRESLKPFQSHPSGSSNPFIGPQVQNDPSKSASGSKRKTAETPEDLEKKKRKVLEGGAAAEAVRICAVCNVVCNSAIVYGYHLKGQKHAAMMKKASELSQSNVR